MEILDQLGVALLSVFGALLARRLRVPARVLPLMPVVLALLIVAVWGGSGSPMQVFGQGIVSGLLASGLLYILLGLMGK